LLASSRRQSRVTSRLPPEPVFKTDPPSPPCLLPPAVSCPLPPPPPSLPWDWRLLAPRLPPRAQAYQGGMLVSPPPWHMGLGRVRASGRQEQGAPRSPSNKHTPTAIFPHFFETHTPRSSSPEAPGACPSSRPFSPEARINYDSKDHYLGSFDTKQEAALAYDREARRCGRKDKALNYGGTAAAEDAAAATAAQALGEAAQPLPTAA
jgi:hypothetical protein